MAFHIELAEGWTKSAHAYDLSEEELGERFLEPRARGEAVWLGGEGYDFSSPKAKGSAVPPRRTSRSPWC